MSGADGAADTPAGVALQLSGLDGSTGGYLVPTMGLGTVARAALGRGLEMDDVPALRARHRARTERTLGVIRGVDPADLASAGWGVILPVGAAPSVRRALEPLLDLRRAQASVTRAIRYREFSGADGVRPNESATAFLSRNGMGPGMPANPDKVPYYLLIVGDPEAIPFDFQYQLDVTHAVGRVAFDTTDELARYAASVAAAEAPAGTLGPVTGAAFFGARNVGDAPTARSADELVGPLAARLRERSPNTAIRTLIGEGAATKVQLARLFSGVDRVGLVFSASHGMAFPAGHPMQRVHQGSLVCQEWPGPDEWRGAIPPEFYLSADDIDGAAHPAGIVAFLFACYGGGTPTMDGLLQDRSGRPERVAPHSFVGRLPQRLLAHPNGGALAVVAHVDRAFSYSFSWLRSGEQLDVFESVLGAILDGERVGSAVEYINDRYAALSTELARLREGERLGIPADPETLVGVWTARNDARDYLILGDPAVRLPPTSA